MKNQKNIKFSGAGASHQNSTSERSIKTLVTMERAILINSALRYPEDTLSTDIWPMPMDYDLCIYNPIPDIKSSLSATEIWSRSIFEPVPETLSKCRVWGGLIYILEPKLHNPGAKIPK